MGGKHCLRLTFLKENSLQKISTDIMTNRPPGMQSWDATEKERAQSRKRESLPLNYNSTPQAWSVANSHHLRQNHCDLCPTVKHEYTETEKTMRPKGKVYTDIS
jgi:hypothetical protein